MEYGGDPRRIVFVSEENISRYSIRLVYLGMGH